MTNSLPGIGILGMGFMGQTHLAAFAAAARAGLCRMVAVADQDPARRKGQAPATGNLATGASAASAPDVKGYATLEELLRDAEVDAIVVCTPTDTHASTAAVSLAAGKHVLVEKPVALDVASIRSVAAAAKAAGRICMPAMCMRFWPGWTWLRETVNSNKYGRVLSASFTRIGSRPGWAPEFYLDPSRSGGALFDLHVHDVDYIQWLLGRPTAVSAVGDDFGVTAVYDYSKSATPAPRRVTATGAWLNPPGFPFRMQYLVEFEHAIADFDLTRTPPLRLIEGGTVSEVPIPPGAGYEFQAVEFANAVRANAAPAATLDQAEWVTATILAERRSQLSGGSQVALT